MLRGFVDFVAEVFGVAETVEARTPMPDGKLIHAQLRLGTVDLMVADRLDGWPARPGLLQLWVTDAAAVLERAGAEGTTTVSQLPAHEWAGLWVSSPLAAGSGHVWRIDCRPALDTALGDVEGRIVIGVGNDPARPADEGFLVRAVPLVAVTAPVAGL
jgi:uncharacterized glyoxalase superfamily protein PhnB